MPTEPVAIDDGGLIHIRRGSCEVTLDCALQVVGRSCKGRDPKQPHTAQPPGMPHAEPIKGDVA